LTTLLTDAASMFGASDAYPNQPDEDCEECRQAVEELRRSYEEGLAAAGLVYEASRIGIEDAHGRLVDEAWAAYRVDVEDSPASERAEMIAQARARYGDEIARQSAAQAAAMEREQEAYTAALRAARETYRVAVEAAVAAHHRPAAAGAGASDGGGGRSEVAYAMRPTALGASPDCEDFVDWVGGPSTAGA
jgi:hypothetical protein